MKLESSTQRRLSIARVLVWIAIIAVSLAAFRSRRPVMIVLVLPLSLYALCFDLARTLRPDFFRSKSLHAVLLGDRPLAETIGIRESSHNLSVRVAMDGAFPWLTIDELGRTEQALTESGFPLQTAQFVLSALQRATGRVLASVENGEGVQQSPHHVSALELYKSV